MTLALAGCIGTIGEQEEDTRSEGEKMFASTVQSMLRGQCAACHEGAGAGPAFLGASGATDDYEALTANGRVVGGYDAGTALLLTKGTHSGVTWWSSMQQSTITSWLGAEAGGHGPGEVTDVMAAWVGCMTLQNWDASGIGNWADKQTDQGATCGGCHADGEHGFHANPTGDIMFAQQRTSVGISSFFQVSGSGTVTPAFDKLKNKISGGNLHPRAAVDDQYVEYLDRFFKLTRATMGAGLCNEPGYRNLTDPL
jgi:hypothetical protein